ncbi:NAD(P)H-dependent oxidoreductase [Streptomyces kanamyceticus]|uniref:NAD(P)H-dependent oxidoreductase n=1 Tax=Streptomyces kanamyceticus TaxID=1967 RepID=UPI0037DD87A4
MLPEESPIYKAACSGLPKAFLDLLPQHAFAGKPVFPPATGGSARRPGDSFASSASSPAPFRLAHTRPPPDDHRPAPSGAPPHRSPGNPKVRTPWAACPSLPTAPRPPPLPPPPPPYPRCRSAP